MRDPPSALPRLIDVKSELPADQRVIRARCRHPSEIDCLLTEQAGVIESATVGGRGQTGDQVWTYTVGETKHDWTSHRVIELQRAHIGPTRVPNVVKFVPSLPKTPPGNILRYELERT